ncbi:MAG: hypothetical protein Q3962_04830 [Corynebacterium sp.]|nr:hypothetical protein [Corynebacterium sp.]
MKAKARALRYGSALLGLSLVFASTPAIAPDSMKLAPQASARSSDAGAIGTSLYNIVFIPNFLIWVLSPFVMYNVLVDLGIIQSIRAANLAVMNR